MHFDSSNFGKDIDNLKKEFQEIDKEIENVESVLSTLTSSNNSPAIDYFASMTKTIASNRDVMLNHFKNIQDYVENVKSNYDSL